MERREFLILRKFRYCFVMIFRIFVFRVSVFRGGFYIIRFGVVWVCVRVGFWFFVYFSLVVRVLGFRVLEMVFVWVFWVIDKKV